MDHRQLLHALVDVGGSDLHCKPGSPPHVRLNGRLRPVTGATLDAATVVGLAQELLPPDRLDELQRTGATLAAHSSPGVGRFRVAGFRQRGSVALVVHHIPDRIATLDELGHPPATAALASAGSGLVLLASPVGGGVTSTLAAVLHHVNATRAAHIMTVEEPIEVLHTDATGLVSQLEVGADTPSVAVGVRNGARFDADVVGVGAIVDRAAAQACLDVVSSGRLVVGAIGATTVAATVHAFLELFTIEERDIARKVLSRCLAGVVAQRLLPTADGRDVVPAVEAMVATPKIAGCIAHSERFDEDLRHLIDDGTYHGMQTMDAALADLVRAGRITSETALAGACAPEELRIALLR